jgi:tripartite-type tricarboxylate transporter receptor subunit TctC
VRARKFMDAPTVVRASAAVLAVAAALWPAGASTQEYPARAVTVVVPFAPGGAFDSVARIIAARMQEIMGQPVVVENVGGGGGTTGVKRVIAAPPDGYTVLLGTVGTHAYNQTIYRNRRYEAVADFTPVTLFSEQTMVLLGRKTLAADTFPEFVQLLKTNGAKMQFGSAGVGSTTHLGCALLNTRIGVSIAHVAYRGGGPAVNDLIGGQIDYFCGNLGGYVGLVQGKQVKAIALLSKERSPLMPELKTAHEQGLTDLDVVTWTAFFLPKGAPRPIVDKLIEVTHAAMETPEIAKRMLNIGVTGVAPERRSPEYLAKFVVEEIARWEEPIKSGGLQVD